MDDDAIAELCLEQRPRVGPVVGQAVHHLSPGVPPVLVLGDQLDLDDVRIRVDVLEGGQPVAGRRLGRGVAGRIGRGAVVAAAGERDHGRDLEEQAVTRH